MNIKKNNISELKDIKGEISIHPYSINGDTLFFENEAYIIEELSKDKLIITKVKILFSKQTTHFKRVDLNCCQ